VFGVSFLEIAVIGLVALVVVGPHKLPAMMRTAGEWVGKVKRITSDMRAQTGIDDILREEGIDGVAELRSLLRGQGLQTQSRASGTPSWAQPAAQPPELHQEFPPEGVDCSSALADDLLIESTPAATPDSSEAKTATSDPIAAPAPPPTAQPVEPDTTS
jgi:sec-independent protein translocase protein TatB